MPVGSCIESWFDKLKAWGAEITWLQPDWYRIWVPKAHEFHTVQISRDLTDECGAIEKRLRNMRVIQDHL